MKGFKNVKVYVEGSGIITTDIAVESGKIVAIGECPGIDEFYNYAENCIVLPGFIDQHVHGAGGADAMDKSVLMLQTIATSLASEGTTSFLATTMTQSEENITESLESINAYISSNNQQGARLLGVHLEGPFISPKFVGAQPIEFVAKPNVVTFKKYNASSGGNIKIVSLAPEIEGALELISYLNEIGVVASVGHSGATYNDISKAVKCGLKNVTHTYNAQSPLHHREVGVVGSAMLFDELNCEIICDTIHVSVPAIKLIIKIKPHDKITLITDAMRAKNLADRISELGGQKVIVKNGEARLENGALAGSVLKMNHAIKNLVEKVGVDICSAVDCASLNPAKNLKIDNLYGSIKVGKLADFAVVDNNFEVISTIRNGVCIFQK